METPMRSRSQSVIALLVGCSLVLASACVRTLPESGSMSAGAATPRVLVVGGGDAHDFDRWFRQADSATLASVASSVRYTDRPADVLPALREADVLYLSNNQPLTDPALRQAIFAHAAAGRGLIIGHAASWYSWHDWPEYNRELVGGGSRAHARYGEFRVDVIAPDHPVMRGVPASFTLRDELYRFNLDAAGPGITVLATAREEATGTVYPIVWTVRHPNARIVVNTLGHDGDAHEHPAYQAILRNSLSWAAQP
jgi:uncharacterized protein